MQREPRAALVGAVAVNDLAVAHPPPPRDLDGIRAIAAAGQVGGDRAPHRLPAAERHASGQEHEGDDDDVVELAGDGRRSDSVMLQRDLGLCRIITGDSHPKLPAMPGVHNRRSRRAAGTVRHGARSVEHRRATRVA